MRSLPHFVLVAAAILVIGCSSEPEKKPAPAAKKEWMALKILSPMVRTITITPEGKMSDVSTVASVSGTLKPDDLKALQDLAAKVDWAKIPGEGYKTATGKTDGREYELTYYPLTPTRIVHSMDGATEDPGFTKLRDTIELDANKIGK